MYRVRWSKKAKQKAKKKKYVDVDLKKKKKIAEDQSANSPDLVSF